MKGPAARIESRLIVPSHSSEIDATPFGFRLRRHANPGRDQIRTFLDVFRDRFQNSPSLAGFEFNLSG